MHKDEDNILPKKKMKINSIIFFWFSPPVEYGSRLSSDIKWFQYIVNLSQFFFILNFYLIYIIFNALTSKGVFHLSNT
jgi:hypothetical protein